MGPKKDSNGKKKGPKSDGIDPGPTDNVNNVNNTGVEGPIPMEISPAKTPAKMDDGNVDMVTPAKPINKNNPSPEDKTSLNKRKNSGNVTAVTASPAKIKQLTPPGQQSTSQTNSTGVASRTTGTDPGYVSQRNTSVPQRRLQLGSDCVIVGQSDMPLTSAVLGTPVTGRRRHNASSASSTPTAAGPAGRNVEFVPLPQVERSSVKRPTSLELGVAVVRPPTPRSTASARRPGSPSTVNGVPSDPYASVNTHQLAKALDYVANANVVNQQSHVPTVASDQDGVSYVPLQTRAHANMRPQNVATQQFQGACASTAATATVTGVSSGSALTSPVKVNQPHTYSRAPLRMQVRQPPNADNPAVVVQLVDNNTTTVQQCLDITGELFVTKLLICKVMELEDEHPVHPLVQRSRRKLCIADHTGTMVGHIKRPQPIHFAKGDSIRMRCFTVKGKQFLIHSNTVTSRTGGVTVPEHIQIHSASEYLRPQTPIAPISIVSHQQAGTNASVKGTVTTTENARTVGPEKNKLVKEITLRDSSGDIKASLWGPAAAYSVIELGQQVTLADCSMYWSKHHKMNMLSVSEADQITVRPPEDIDESIMVVGVDETERYNTVILEVYLGPTNQLLTIDRFYISEQFNYRGPMTVTQLCDYLPFRANVHISGQNITGMSNISVPASAVAPVPQTQDRQSVNDEDFGGIHPPIPGACPDHGNLADNDYNLQQLYEEGSDDDLI